MKVDPFVVGPEGHTVPPFTSGLTRRIMLSKFLDDPVLCVGGRLITRADVIRYVANKAGAIHYDDTRHKTVENAIDRARSAVTLRLHDGQIVQEVNFDYLNDQVPPLEFLPARLDCALVQILATCGMLHVSPAVTVLSDALRDSIARSQTRPG